MSRSHAGRLLGAPDSTLGSALGRFEQRIVWALVYFHVVLAAGTVGYRVLEDWSWFDALYMSVITATSVGFAEIHPLSPAGRVFTMAFLAFTVTGLGFLWAITTALIVELDLGDSFRRKRMRKRIERISGHYVVCGGGRMGIVILDEMHKSGETIVLVERNGQRIEEARARFPDLLVAEGDATKDDVLGEAGVRRAKGLAAALAEDADNLFLCLTARSMNPDLVISSRTIDGEAVPKMHQAGADHIVLPNVTGGVRMAATLLKPSVVSFLDAATIAEDVSLRLEEVMVPERSNLARKTLAESRIPEETGLIVLALRRSDSGGPAVFNPGKDTCLEGGDVMIVLGQQDQVERLRSFAGA